MNVPTPPDPEVGEASGGATIWLHRSLPDPTPAARRLTPAFARALRTQSARAGADWALVLGVLRADGRVGRTPATPGALRALSTRLVKLGAKSDEWSAALALRGRTAFADRAVAAARLHRAVGLRALVTGLESAKRRLERLTLADRRISIYSGGRSDIAAHRIDIRVLVLLRYLAEGFGQVTVSSLQSGHRIYSRPGVVSAHVYGLAVDIASLGGLSIIGNQAPGSITEQAVRATLLLPARPAAAAGDLPDRAGRRLVRDGRPPRPHPRRVLEGWWPHSTRSSSGRTAARSVIGAGSPTVLSPGCEDCSGYEIYRGAKAFCSAPRLPSTRGSCGSRSTWSSSIGSFAS